MPNQLQMEVGGPVAGLGTFSYTITQADAGLVTLGIKTTLPLNSGLLTVVNQNATPRLTFGGAVTNPTPTQISTGSSVRMQCVAGDVISLVLSSSALADQIPNAVKSVVTLYKGF
jgi:hypothetical protein